MFFEEDGALNSDILDITFTLQEQAYSMNIAVNKKEKADELSKLINGLIKIDRMGENPQINFSVKSDGAKIIIQGNLQHALLLLKDRGIISNGLFKKISTNEEVKQILNPAEISISLGVGRSQSMMPESPEQDEAVTQVEHLKETIQHTHDKGAQEQLVISWVITFVDPQVIVKRALEKMDQQSLRELNEFIALKVEPPTLKK